jgi:hypothetical protein
MTHDAKEGYFIAEILGPPHASAPPLEYKFRIGAQYLAHAALPTNDRRNHVADMSHPQLGTVAGPL